MLRGACPECCEIPCGVYPGEPKQGVLTTGRNRRGDSSVASLPQNDKELRAQNDTKRRAGNEKGGLEITGEKKKVDLSIASLNLRNL